MPSIPFAYQSYNRTSSLQPASICRNLFAEKDATGNTTNEDGTMLLQRPGLTRYQQLPANIRGFFLSENVNDARLYAVAGDQVLAINGTSAAAIGTVLNDEQSVAFAPTFDKMAIASGGSLYTYFQDDQTTGTFGKIAMPDDRQVIDIAELNNYIIVACADGRFFWLLPGKNAIGALDFLTAESSTDGLVAVKRIGDELYFFGVSSIEVWSATGDLDLPFVRSNGRNLNAGLLFRDTVRLLDNTLMWVGTTGYVYRADTVPKRISNASIEERIAKRTGPLSALSLTIEGHQFYCLKIPGQGTFCYDGATTKWCEFASLGRSTWRPAFSVVVGSDTLLADDSSGLIWRFDPDVNTDDGAAMERVATGTITLPPKPQRNNNFAIDVGASAPCNFRLRWHDAMEPDFPDAYETMAARAGNDRLSLYRLNQARGQYRTFEISVIDDVRVRFGDARANEAWQ
jgi:hypothetical protein